MVNITFRPDDSGLQSLKKENTTPQTAREVTAPAAPARAHYVADQGQLPPQPQQTIEEYKGVERRKGERRKGKQRIILDTRDNRERRRQQQTTEEKDQQQPTSKVGIDVYG